jgi:flavin reductase (DIM6/NTAB) family NADH-FMN oxidoreductase RutF
VLIDVAETDPQTVYRALVGVVTPRPIAWVTSIDRQGRANLAPFSFYNTFGGTPPVVVFSPNRKLDGSKKDTLRNIAETGEFVINAAVAELAEQVNLSSTGLPHGESEIELTGLTAAPSLKVKPPRIQESPVHLECRLLQILQIGAAPQSANLVIGQVLLMNIDDRILDARGRIDPRKLRAIGRLGGSYYTQSDDPFEMQRPPSGQ